MLRCVCFRLFRGDSLRLDPRVSATVSKGLEPQNGRFICTTAVL